ncbi:MAG: helix-turn-helix domain-containing protein, partial [Candidatus Flemingiibacterium sp.]
NTIRQHIIDTRITTAMRMLSEGHKNSDVAYMCGFASESSFIHTFSERVGISPSKFAKNSFSRKS